MPRSPEDYGIPGLDDATLAILAGDVRRYGEKGKYAQRELAQRRGLISQANSYRTALERSAYSDAGRQYGQGINDITRYLAGAGPMGDSGGATALRARLASQVYGGAQSRIGGGYADLLRQLIQGRQGYRYQRQLELLRQKGQKKKGPLDYLAGAAGGVIGGLTGGPPGAVAGYGAGSSIGSGPGGSQLSNYQPRPPVWTPY